jgi:hypothetical protein
MLHAPTSLHLGLEDLVGDVSHARKQHDLGRLATLCYCEVRRWARLAGEQRLADRSSALITQQPPADRRSFLNQVDELIEELEAVHTRWCHAEGEEGCVSAASTRAADRS